VLPGGGAPGGGHTVEETVMQYLEFITTLNPVVLAILVVVLVCGAYDYWVQSR
jgi:hypothetical protein